MDRRKSWLERLDLAEEANPRQPLVEVCGNQRVIVEHHRGVMAYGREVIQIRLSGGSIRIQGCGLLLRKMCPQQLAVTGKIAAIFWEMEGE